ncbi:MAG TPA: SH3 domain-containing protein [Candidatus Acidoferrum sp.]
MKNKLLIFSTFAGLAVTLPAFAAENSGSSVAAAPGTLRGTVVCRGVQNVPVTSDAEQSLPMQLVARLNCGDEVAVLSDSEGYTVNIRTVDGRDGYVARMYINEHVATDSKDIRSQAVVDNGIARWQSGAPGSDQFYSGSAVVESLTADGITVQVSLQDTGWKLRATVAIANEGDTPVHFNPAGFTLAELQPRLRTLAYQNPKELAKALTHQVYWTNASATASASAVYTKAVYKSGATAPTPNYLSEAEQQVQSTVLHAATVGPKEKASGVVWFERDKNSQQLNLRIFVSDQIFEFPLSFPQHN